MPFHVDLTPRARRQLKRADEWWRENRPAAPELLREELQRAISNLASFPELGRGVSEGRRIVILPHTATSVIYRVRPKRQRIEIIQILAARGA